MRIFELHFDPKQKNDQIFNSFVYEPQTASEERLGSLYVVGEFQKALPQNSRFLDNLASLIKKEFYSASLQKSGEGSLKDALKKANEFLDKEARSGNVNWLGNLHFAILNFKDFILNFTKVGGMKILLFRDGEFLDIGHNLEFQEQDPYPLKVFGNVAVGKLAPDDKVILLTKDLFSVLAEKTNFFNQLKNVSNEKELKKILKEENSVLSKASGICFLLFCGKELQTIKKVTFKKEKYHFSLKSPRVNFSIRTPGKNKLLLGCLILILIIGFFIFHFRPKNNIIELKDKEQLELAKSKVSMAENFLIFKKEEKAKELFLEAQSILTSLITKNSPLKEEAASLQKTIEGYLQQ